MKLFEKIFVFCLLALIQASCHKNAESESATVSAEELRSVFRFDLQQNVYDNLLMLNDFERGVSHLVNGKTLVVSECVPDNVDALRGEFSLLVKGTVNRSPFQLTLTFTGFKVEKPGEDGDGGQGQEEDATLSPEELRCLFIFDTNQTVEVALAGLEEFKGERHINGKLVLVNVISVKCQDVLSGAFTLWVEGKINGTTDFGQELSFDGFAVGGEEGPGGKPTDYHMAQRASVRVAQGKNIYDADFDTFFREGKPEAFAAQLKDFLSVTSSDSDGRPYAYTPEDMEHTSFSGLRYDLGEKKLCLKVVYKGNVSPELSVLFDKDEYYRPFAVADPSEAGKYYQSGVLHYMEETGEGGALFSRLVKAREGFLVEYRSHLVIGQHIGYSVRLLSSDHRELALFDVVVTGFRNISDLENELVITGGRYSDYVRDRLKPGMDIGELVRSSFRTHISDLSFSLEGGVSLTYSPEGPLLFSEIEKTVFFKEVVFEYHSVERDETGGITLNVKLSAANGSILDAVIPVRHFLLRTDLE